MNPIRAVALLSAFLLATAIAQTPGPTRVRGTITGIDGNTVSVKSREGQDLTIELAPNATFAYMKKVSLSDITHDLERGHQDEPVVAIKQHGESIAVTALHFDHYLFV